MIGEQGAGNQTMGDVLAKEEQQQEAEAPTASPDDRPQEQPPPTHPPPVDVLAGDRPPSATPVPQPPAPFHLDELTDEKDDLQSEVSSDNEKILENIESALLENKDLSETIDTSSEIDLCKCEACKLKKSCTTNYLTDISKEDLHEIMRLRQLGMDLKQYIYYTFNWFIETTGFSENSFPLLPQEPQDLESIKSFAELRESVNILWDKIPDYLLMWLVGQAQEFMVFIKGQLMATYNHGIDNLAEVFLTKLLDGYDTLLATAVHISDLLEPLQKVLSKVDLSWEYINKSLYQYYIYNDPLIQNSLPPFIGQLRQYLPYKGTEYHDLVHRYLAFDEEITRVRNLYPEIKRIIDRYNAEEVNDLVIKQVREDVEKLKHMFIFSQPMLSTVLSDKKLTKELDSSIKDEKNKDSSQESYFQACAVPDAVELKSMFVSLRKSSQQKLDDLVDALTLPCVVEEAKKPKISKEQIGLPSNLEKGTEDGISQPISNEVQTCDCQPQSISIESTSMLQQEKSQNLQDNVVNHCMSDSDACKEPTVPANTEQQNSVKQHIENCKELFKKISKTRTAQTVQTQTRHSTTQTPSVTHTQNAHRHHHQGRCSSHSHLHGSLSNGVIKSSGPHRTHVGHKNHPSAAATCHKQQHIVEHIKRLSTNDLSPGENGDCSDSASSHEDSCSTTNSPTPRESNRHCDCCYCEVFGHGVPSVAPVSRNYNEMRERLRQLLSKKKAKVCASSCNPHSKNSVEVSSSSSSLSSFSSTSSTVTNADGNNHPNPALRTTAPSTKTVTIPPAVAAKVLNATKTADPTVALKPKEEPWNIEAAVEFIEGNQSGSKNTKKAEKKARQKQKKLEEKLKKDKEEEEKQKLIELQKKNPEVTITVVNPQKQSSQKQVPQPKLPEISILPAKIVRQPTITVSKQSNIGKKQNVEIVTNSAKNANKSKTIPPAVLAPVENAKKKTATLNKTSNVISSNNTKSKAFGKVASEVAPQTPINDNSGDLSNLTKTQRKKLRRRMEKEAALQKELESKKSAPSSENQSQIVTIKRIMEANNAEPTVTITLKGQTPAEDRVLFTLVNGQTKDSAGDKQQTGGKKKKNKGNNSANQNVQEQVNNKQQQSLQQIVSAKSETSKKNESKNNKQQQQPQSAGKEKSKNAKQQEESKLRQQQNINNVPGAKSVKSKKDKKKDIENKENIKQPTNVNLQKQEIVPTNKKPNQAQVVPKQQQQPQQQQQQQQQVQTNSNGSNKNAKAEKKQKDNKNQNLNQTQSSNQNQSQKKVNNQVVSGKSSKGNTNANTNTNKTTPQANVANQKTVKVTQSVSSKQQKPVIEPAQYQRRDKVEPVAPQSSNYREVNRTPQTIDIENLKLPPGITITKVDAPARPLPLKTSSAPKPVNNTPKQTTIIAAPLSGVQSNYGNPQGTGNVIVVDTGRLKQDLAPRSNGDPANGQTSSSKKKKKKKNKNAAAASNERVPGIARPSGANDYVSMESARIVHNPATNMVTIRNPAFGPPTPPRIEPPPQQAAIIKVNDNGMVTIRSPALQQAINAGLHPPAKPDFVAKATISPHEPNKQGNLSGHMNGGEPSGAIRGSNGMPLSSELADLRRRLGQPSSDIERSSVLFNNGLSSIQISKVTNGQSPNIPENGINLRGTSVTLTKIRNPEPPQLQQQQPLPPSSSSLSSSSSATQPQYDEAKGAPANGATVSKNRKKKKRGNGVRQSGDDWNLVESVFTPKDIDLEDGEMDDAERELEAFKRFCLQSVPPPRKEKVNLNLKDIVLKKKSAAVVAAT